jgi:hypothetical protein
VAGFEWNRYLSRGILKIPQATQTDGEEREKPVEFRAGVGRGFCLGSDEINPG